MKYFSFVKSLILPLSKSKSWLSLHEKGKSGDTVWVVLSEQCNCSLLYHP